MQDAKFAELLKKFMHYERMQAIIASVITLVGLVLIVLVSFFFSKGNLNFAMSLVGIGVLIELILIILMVVYGIGGIRAAFKEINSHIKAKYKLSIVPVMPTLTIPLTEQNTASLEQVAQHLSNNGFRRVRVKGSTLKAKRLFFPIDLITLGSLLLLLGRRFEIQRITVRVEEKETKIRAHSLYPAIDLETIMEIVHIISPTKTIDVAHALKTEKLKASKAKMRLMGLLFIAIVVVSGWLKYANQKSDLEAFTKVVTQPVPLEQTTALEPGTLYTLFELPATDRHNRRGNHVIGSSFFTDCDRIDAECKMFNLSTLEVHTLSFGEYEQLVPPNTPKTDLGRNNVITLAGFTRLKDGTSYSESGLQPAGTRIDYRTPLHDYRVNCDPIYRKYVSSFTRPTGRHCLFVEKRDGVFENGEKSRDIVRNFSKIDDMVILEKDILWYEHDEEKKQNVYYLYHIE